MENMFLIRKIYFRPDLIEVLERNAIPINPNLTKARTFDLK